MPPHLHGVEGAVRAETINALLLTGSSTVFYSFAAVVVWSLCHLKGRPAENQHWWGENTTGAEEVGGVFLYEPLDAVSVLCFQCVIEGLFMSSVVGVPTLLAYLARKAEDERAKEREMTRAAAHAGTALPPPVGAPQPLRRRESAGSLLSNHSMTSADLVGIVVDDAWCDVDDEEEGDAMEESVASRPAAPSIPPRRTVTFNRIIAYDPPPPPPIPLDQVTSRLKYITRPAVVQAMHAHLAASVLIATVAAREIQAERERTPMPVTLPRRQAAMLCALYGVVKCVSTAALYVGFASSLALIETVVLFSSAPAFGTLYRCVVLGDGFSWKHIPGGFLVFMSCGLIVMTLPHGIGFAAPLCVVFLGGGGFALAGQLHNDLRLQVHPYFIAVSFTIVGGVGCGVVHLLQGNQGPSGAQWGQLMLLCMLALAADALSASGDVEKIDVPSGVARSLFVALPMGLQTVVIAPLSSSSSLAAVLAFSAHVFLEVSRMSTSRHPSYTQLITETDPFPPLPLPYCHDPAAGDAPAAAPPPISAEPPPQDPAPSPAAGAEPAAAEAPATPPHAGEEPSPSRRSPHRKSKKDKKAPKHYESEL
eukprot:TRINITY_DN19605_c0_g1_i1.p1 TRINITY_DN19605_c0_g1~~TRINITY_DN19605_c0_g1_i1.p1  ORF type:complete len:592 (+),score=201.44 TRINITY_DN19605_c0_g1_i1:151-1926(+)